MMKFIFRAKMLTWLALVFSLMACCLVSCSLTEGRETAKEYASDVTITTKIKEAFIADPQVRAMQVNVETMQGVVQLSGFVESINVEQRAVQLAQQVEGVKLVKDNIAIRVNSTQDRP